MLYSLMSECMMGLKPFLQPFHYGYEFTEDYGLGSLSNPSRDPYAEFGKVKRTEPERKKPVEVVQSQSSQDVESHEQISRRSSRRRPRRQELDIQTMLRSYYTSSSSHVEADHKDSWALRKRSDEDDIEVLQRQHSGIQQTTTVSVVDESIAQRK